MPRNPSGAESDVTWGRSTVRTACPLDCPDSCTLDVTVENGRVVKIDGGDANPVTRGFICAKVRPIHRPSLRRGSAALSRRSGKAPRGRGCSSASPGTKRSITSRGACWKSATRPVRKRSCRSATAARTGSSRRTRTMRRCFAASAALGSRARSAPRRLAPRTGSLRQDAGVTYADYVARTADRPVGRQSVRVRDSPGAVLKEAQNAGARLVVVDPRATSLARQADLHLAPAWNRLPLALALHRFLFESGFADEAFLASARDRRRRSSRPCA